MVTVFTGPQLRWEYYRDQECMKWPFILSCRDLVSNSVWLHFDLVVPTKGMNAVAGSSRCSNALLGLPGPRVHRLVCFAPLTICGCFVVLQKPLWSAVVLRCKYCSMSFLDFIKALYFFPGWLCNFKELFIPVWREIHRSKILPVTSWQLTNRTVSDISRRSRHSIVNLFFFPWIYNMIQIHADETSRPPNFVARSVAARPRALKLASLTFQLVRGRLVASLSIFNLLYYVIWW